ncbi:peptide-methionine (R)-S-oxide reductase [Microdochium nivale]|nr:peptide-methionine (R)-S-oxide reductase [Microdochium nivale]
MRMPPFSSLLRTLFTLSSLGRVRVASAAQAQQAPNLLRQQQLKSMPTIPFLSSLFGSGSSSSNDMSYPDKRSDDEWRAVLTPEQFRILRQKGTEPPGSGKYDKFHSDTGVYTCAGCEAPLYTANHKFKSGCGWPAYFDSIPGAVTRHTDSTFGMSRTEIVCSNCGGHLGHVFKGEGYATPTDERHCVNSVSINFSPKDKVVDETAKTDSKV